LTVPAHLPAIAEVVMLITGRAVGLLAYTQHVVRSPMCVAVGTGVEVGVVVRSPHNSVVKLLDM
jgi:hypothetical protein